MREITKAIYRTALRAQGVYGVGLFIAYFASLSSSHSIGNTLPMAITVVVVAVGMAPVFAIKAVAPRFIWRPRRPAQTPAVFISHSLIAIMFVLIGTTAARALGVTHLMGLPVSLLLTLGFLAQWLTLAVGGTILSLIPSPRRSYAAYYDSVEPVSSNWHRSKG